jgi:hypothetical protein
MSMLHFFPATDAEQVNWLTHYALRLTINGTTCGISAREIARTQADLLYHRWFIQFGYPARLNDAKAIAAYKKQLLTGHSQNSIIYPEPISTPKPPPQPVPGIYTRLMNQISRIKASPNYTETIGKDLGILPLMHSVEHSVPDYWLTTEIGMNASRVQIDFTKYGHEGIWI